MNQAGWAPEEREEFRVLLVESIESSADTAERRDHFLGGLDGALQAHRFWASEVDREIRSRGADSMLKAFQKAQTRVQVAYDGRILQVPRAVGVARRTPSGRVRHQQRLFDYLTWDEIKEKRAEHLRQVRSYNDLIATLDKLLALADVAPGTTTPAEAATMIGTTVEGWLLNQSTSA